MDETTTSSMPSARVLPGIRWRLDPGCLCCHPDPLFLDEVTPPDVEVDRRSAQLRRNYAPTCRQKARWERRKAATAAPSSGACGRSWNGSRGPGQSTARSRIPPKGSSDGEAPTAGKASSARRQRRIGPGAITAESVDRGYGGTQSAPGSSATTLQPKYRSIIGERGSGNPAFDLDRRRRPAEGAQARKLGWHVQWPYFDKRPPEALWSLAGPGRK